MLLACLEEGFNCLPPAVFAQALERFLLTVGDKCGIAVFLLALADCFSLKATEALLKGFVPSNLLKETMVDIFRDAVLIRKKMRKLPGQYPRKRLPFRGKKISGQRKNLW